MAGSTGLTVEAARRLVTYNPETGEFFRAAMVRLIPVGTPVGYLDNHGYVRVAIGGKVVRGHRLAWALMTGEWPKDQIDHINGIRSDNRWSNLREATNSFNLQNLRRARADSQSGLLGVTRGGKRWRATIKTEGRYRYLGTFETPEAASAAYLAAKRRLHPGSTL